MPRAQSIVCRDDRVLMVRHRDQNSEWWCLPGGRIHEEESPAEAALRELAEECNVVGAIVRATSVVYAPDDWHYTFLVDIGGQEPCIGHDPEFSGCAQILAEVRWLALEEIPERDRAFLWSAGLLGVGQFARVVESWRGEVSYPQINDSASDR